jgi:hypothetical protein
MRQRDQAGVRPRTCPAHVTDNRAAVTVPGAFEPDLAKWDAWRPDEVRRLLARVEAPWCVAAGWAIDLFLGGKRREHEDLEIAVPRDRFGQVAEALAGYELFVAGSGLVRPIAEAGRRDERIRLPYDQLIERSADGIPYARPEVVLLFKAKHARAKDDGDLAAVLPLLEPGRRRWLAETLELVHPGHRWLGDLPSA